MPLPITNHHLSSDPLFSRVPGLLEFAGYAFNFQTVLVGPMVDFRHYKHFIETGVSPPPPGAPVDKVRSSLSMIDVWQDCSTANSFIPLRGIKFPHRTHSIPREFAVGHSPENKLPETEQY